MIWINQLYADSGHAQLLSSHGQEVLFSVPKQLVEQFSEQYGIAVRAKLHCGVI
jgi:hypothetical protein